jgi:hypothetical protein
MTGDEASKADDTTSPEAGIVLTKAAYYARYYREVQKPRRAAGLVAHKAASNGGSGPSRTVYQPLLDVLAAHPEPAVALTFAEIEALLDAALPSPGAIRRAFGPADRTTSARLLHVLGWRARLDMRGRVAYFARNTP